MALMLRRFTSLRLESQIFDISKSARVNFLRFDSTYNSSINDMNKKDEENEFRVLQLYPTKSKEQKQRKSFFFKNAPRTVKMSPDMDWTNIWPGPKTFHPASVPLPLHQGFNKSGPPPNKVANTELMKIPNFLHLTPPAIKKHCEAIKHFCTQWPENLKTDEDIEKHFPVEIVTSDYCHSSCSIREPKARIVSLKIKLKNLKFDEHSRDKFLRLVGKRYDPSTDYVTITTDSCPIKKQNYEYAHYLITAVYFESWKVEEWEKLKSEEDMEKYKFSQRKVFQNMKELFDYNKKELLGLNEYEKAFEDWMNQGDNLAVINKYKEAAMKLLSIPPFEV